MTKSEKFITACGVLAVGGIGYYGLSNSGQIREKLEAAQSALNDAREEMAFETAARFSCLDYLETEVYDHAVTLSLAVDALDLVDWELSQSAQVCEAVN